MGQSSRRDDELLLQWVVSACSGLTAADKAIEEVLLKKP
jgi:hypothetical protein